MQINFISVPFLCYFWGWWKCPCRGVSSAVSWPHIRITCICNQQCCAAMLFPAVVSTPVFSDGNVCNWFSTNLSILILFWKPQQEVVISNPFRYIDDLSSSSVLSSCYTSQISRALKPNSLQLVWSGNFKTVYLFNLYTYSEKQITQHTKVIHVIKLLFTWHRIEPLKRKKKNSSGSWDQHLPRLKLH